MTNRRMSIALFLLIAVCISVQSASAAPRENRDWAACRGTDIDARISACTRILEDRRISAHERGTAHNLRSIGYYRKGDYAAAIRDVSEAIGLIPRDATLYLNRCDSYKASGDYDHAIHDCDEAIRLNPKLAGAYNLRGLALMHKGERVRAVRDFEEAIRLDPKNSSAYNNRGLTSNEKGEYDRAIRDYDEAIRIDPKNAIAYNNRGYTNYNRGEYDRAIPDFDEAIRLNSKYANAYNGRGVAYAKKGEQDRAIRDYDEAIRLNPKYTFAYYNRGNAYAKKGEYDTAIRDFDEALRLDPKYLVAYRSRASAFFEKGDHGRALRDLDEAVNLDANNAISYNLRGFVFKQNGDFDRAIQDLDEAIRLDPKMSVALSNRGDAYRRKGDLDRAIADLSEAIRLDSRITPAYAFRGLAYEAKGERERAVADFKAVLALPSHTFTTGKQAHETARARLAALEVEVQPVSAPPPVAALTPPSPAAVAPANPGRRVALVVGNSAYKTVARLPNPRGDAELVATALRAVGFQSVRLENDLARDKLIDALRAFGREAEGADWAVVYFAGHGIEAGGVNYLVPVDARLETDRDLQYEAVALEQVLGSVEAARKLRLVILDACRDNPFARQMRRTVASRSIGRGLGRVEPEGGTLVAYSAKHGEVALDGEGTNSPFVMALVKRLPTPGMEINKLFRVVRDDVMAATERKQEPFVYGSLPGEDFFFVAGK
jgi:tetratricopeptide (TPR) repeat protein